MNTSSLNLRYIGSADELGVSSKLEAHYDGQVAIHTSVGPDRARQHLVSIQGGPHLLYTLHPIDLLLLSGACEVAAGDAAPRKLSKRPKRLARGSAFTIKARSFSQILCTPQPGPGLGSDGREHCVLE